VSGDEASGLAFAIASICVMFGVAGMFRPEDLADCAETDTLATRVNNETDDSICFMATTNGFLY
jgi:hypothetical protein